MKKSLLALAVMASLSTVAHAQSSVTVFGVVDVALAYENNAAGHVLRQDSGQLNGSRIGFKGTEDLGGGLSANFMLENGFTADNGALGQGGLFFGRQSWVGLNGDFGSVKVGRQNTVIYTNSAVFDPFKDALAGDSVRLFNYAGSRVNNTVSYSYAATNGLRGEVDYSFGEVAGNNAAGRNIAGYVGYKNGPIDAVLAYNKATDATGNDSAKTTLIGGNYDFGAFRPYAAYAINKGVGTLNTRNGLIGLAIPITSRDLFMTSWIVLRDKNKSGGDANQIAFGYVHTLSIRTALYTSYSRTGNGAAAQYNSGALAASDNLFNVGIRHSF